MIGRLGAQLPGMQVSRVADYRDQLLGPLARQIALAAALSAGAAGLLAVLMTMMFTRMSLAVDRGQVAIQRAIGTPDRQLRRQYLHRILTVLAGYLAKLTPRAELNDRARQLMERVGVGELGDRDISQASGGQLQRTAICRALINEPLILFGDEPTGALDSTAAEEIMAILEELNAGGMTVVLVTHDPGVAVHGDRVVYMVDGRIVAELAIDRERGLRKRRSHLDGWLTGLR